jgi:pimeloyl-ACP methyl ester carboxylesterase
MSLQLTLVAFVALASTDVQTSKLAAPPPADRQVAVDGVSLHYVDWGGSGEALVFLPPACETAYIFGDIAPAFANTFQVVGPTTRGCGRSGRAAEYDLDAQLTELEGFLDALNIDRATFVGFSASGGKAIRFAGSRPSRVRSLVILDTVYSHVAPGYSEQLGAEIRRRISGNPNGSVTLFRRYHEGWELGAWSTAMDRNLRETHELAEDGSLRPRGAKEWRSAFIEDMKAGRYFETRISHPALMVFAVDLDQERVRQIDEPAQTALRPLAVETDRRRREQIEAFRKNGSHVQIVEMSATAHYCFLHRPDEVIQELRRFLKMEPSR